MTSLRAASWNDDVPLPEGSGEGDAVVCESATR